MSVMFLSNPFQTCNRMQKDKLRCWSVPRVMCQQIRIELCILYVTNASEMYTACGYNGMCWFPYLSEVLYQLPRHQSADRGRRLQTSLTYYWSGIRENRKHHDDKKLVVTSQNDIAFLKLMMPLHGLEKLLAFNQRGSDSINRKG